MGTLHRYLKAGFPLLPEVLFGLVLLGLLLIILLPAPEAGASTSPDYIPRAAAAGALPLQGTPLVTTVSDAIDGTEPTFTAQRHFRSGIYGDRICRLFVVTGPRLYDEVLLFISSPTSQ